MKTARTFSELYSQLKLRKIPFLAVFFVVVVLTYGFLYAIDFIPEAPDEVVEATGVLSESELAELEATEPVATAPAATIAFAQPIKIIFDSLNNKEVTVLNPASRDIDVLDEALLQGAVRHPDSADFAEDGNIFILGHSSYLPNILNRNFQAFNGIQNMTWGDRIRLQSEDTEYVYRVERVYEAAASDVIVPFTPGEARLTLATCDSFGSVDDRFIVEAVLIGKTAL